MTSIAWTICEFSWMTCGLKSRRAFATESAAALAPALLKSRESLYSQAEIAVDTSRLEIEGAVEEIARKVA